MYFPSSEGVTCWDKRWDKRCELPTGQGPGSWGLGRQGKQGCLFKQGGELAIGHCQPIRPSLQAQCLLLEQEPGVSTVANEVALHCIHSLSLEPANRDLWSPLSP